MRRLIARIALCSLALIPAIVASSATPAPRTHVAEGGGVQPFGAMSSTTLVAEGGGVQPFGAVAPMLGA